MCGRFGLWAEPGQIEQHFQVQLHLHITPRYNIPPGEEILAIGQTEDGLRKAAWLHWGLVPQTINIVFLCGLLLGVLGDLAV